MLSSFILILFFCSKSCAGDVNEQLHKDCLYPTICIGHDEGYGTGFIIRSEKESENKYKNVFLSCAHITKNGVKDYEVRQYVYENWSTLKGVRSYPATFYAINLDLDISVGCFYSQEEMPTAKLEMSPQIFIGNEVFKFGCGALEEPRLDYGKMTLIKSGAKPYFRTSILTIPGDSGAPVFHNNKVIGIIAFIKVNRHGMLYHISFALPLERFKIWSHENDDSLDFVWDKTKPIPMIPFHYLEFAQ